MAHSRLCSIPDCSKPHKSKGYCEAHYTRLLRHGDPLGGSTSPGEPLRFIQEVALQHTGEECLTWPFGKSIWGYGTLWVNGNQRIASRYICELVHGAPPTPEHDAAHSCGKGSEACISPIHLSWKTKAENSADRLIHGTHNRGERHNIAKLTEAEVRAIIDLKGILSQYQIAKKFGVTQSNVSCIHSGRSWSWLSEGAKA
jgi:hypothetical protein